MNVRKLLLDLVTKMFNNLI